MSLKRLVFLYFAVLGAIAVVGKPAQSATLIDRAREEAASEITGRLPRDAGVRRLAVLPIKGDSGYALYGKLIEALKKRSPFEIIVRERGELDRILDEWKFQHSDLADPATRVEPGLIPGAEGLLFGAVVTEKSVFGSAEYSVVMRLDSVKRGEILWKDEIVIALTSPVRAVVLWGGGIVLVLLVILVLVRGRSVQRVEARLEEDERVRFGVTDEVDRINTHLQEIKSLASERRDDDLAVRAADAQKGLLMLRESLVAAPRGAAGRTSEDEARQAKQFDQHFRGVIQGLIRHGEQATAAAHSGDRAGALRALEELGAGVASVRNQFLSRNSYIR